MIVEIPTADDLRLEGVAYLNLSWTTVVQLVTDLAESGLNEPGGRGCIEEEYWDAAQRQLATAIDQLHQGVDFLLKSRIAAVSPYLLIDGSPRDWPSACHKQDTSFAAFRTLSSQDLRRAHDAVAEYRLSETFWTNHEELRVRRNRIKHTLDPSQRFRAQDVLEWILEASHNLLSDQSWTSLRQDYIESEPKSIAWAGLPSQVTLAFEFDHVLDGLETGLLKEYFGFNRRQRRYICGSCRSEASGAHLEIEAKTAQLRPNRPDSERVFCFVCRGETRVSREDCQHKGCRGLDLDYGVCLTCFGVAELEVPGA